MSGVVSSLFVISVPHGRLDECITSLEEGLRSIRTTPFHAILGHTFLHHREAVATFITEFYETAMQSGPIAAMYFEMNGFTINPDRWYFNGFGYKKGGDNWDLTWNLD